MLTFLVTYGRGEPVHQYLRWGEPTANEFMKLMTYGEAARASSLPSGCYVFAGTDRLTGASKPVATELYGLLTSDPNSVVLNHPELSMNRYRLLRELEERGINSFKARPIDQVDELECPLFIRHSVQHDGAYSPPLQSKEEVGAFVRRLRLKGFPKKALLAVEFADSSGTDGIYRKYAAFRIGDRIWPHAIWFSDHWMMKRGHLADNEKVEEEFAYIQDNPHVDLLRSTFELAHIEYGRIDYTFVDGRFTVFEINSNPSLFPHPLNRPAERDQAREKVKLLQRENFLAAFRSLAEVESSGSREIPIAIPWSRRAPLAAESVREATVLHVARALRHRLTKPERRSAKRVP